TWDGYAVRPRDTVRATARSPVRLQVVGEVYAEQRFDGTVGPGEAVAIATGGAMPRGARGVVIFEEVVRSADSILVPHPVRPGERVAPPGDDFRAGSRLFVRGSVLDPAALGAVAACGRPSVVCYARPVVAVVPNGNELVAPGGTVGPGTIYESNNATLSAVIAAFGGIARLYPPVADDPDRIEATLREAMQEADLVLATGGSSVGERDHLPRILPRLGRLLFHGIAVRPGKPTLAAATERGLVIGLPGHPSSCLANSFWLVGPVLRRLGRRPGPAWTDVTVRLGAGELVPSREMATVVPLRLRDGRAYTTYHGSSSISSMAGAQGFAVLPPGGRPVRAGARLLGHWLPAPLGPPLDAFGANG
ncbi:Molybdenum cofactor biosynthesis protein MoeA, partial [mine drainage metagenome]